MGYRGGEAHRAKLGVRCRVVRCTRCGLIYPNPMPFPREAPDQHYQNPEEFFAHQATEVKHHSGLQLMEQFEQHLGGKGRFLDVGCGRGELVAAAQERGWQAEGVDVSTHFVRYARERYGVTAHAGGLDDQRFPDARFDAIAMGAVLEHVYDPRGLLVEAARVLRPGGVLWIDVPNEAGLFFLVGNLYLRLRGLDWVVNLAPTFPLYHVYGFTPSALRRVLTHTGFGSIQIVTYAGHSVTPRLGSLSGWVEASASAFVHAFSRWGLGNYMYAWVRRT